MVVHGCIIEVVLRTTQLSCPEYRRAQVLEELLLVIVAADDDNDPLEEPASARLCNESYAFRVSADPHRRDKPDACCSEVSLTDSPARFNELTPKLLLLLRDMNKGFCSVVW